MARPTAPLANGFALVELLAALAVLSLLCLLIAAGLGSRSRALGRMERDTRDGEAVEAAQMALADRVEHIWPQTINYIHPPGPDFDGRALRLRFLAPPPQSGGVGPLRRYQLSLDDQGELVLDSLSDVALDQGRWTGRQVLARGVKAIELAYFGPAAPDYLAAWRSQWREQAFMPALVRVRVAFADNDRRRWPDLVIHPAADIDTGCQLVVIAEGCRGR